MVPVRSMTHKNYALFRRRRSTVGTVTETGAIVWNSGGKKLWISCWEGDFDTVKFYVDHGEKFNLPQFYQNLTTFYHILP